MIKRLAATGAAVLLGTGLAAGCAAQEQPVAEATLTGGAEGPGPGDPDGTGTAHVVLYPGQGRVCFGITVNNITVPATLAHIHQRSGRRGRAGGRVVDTARSRLELSRLRDGRAAAT